MSVTGYKKGYLLCDCGYMQGLVVRSAKNPRQCDKCHRRITNTRVYSNDEVDPFTRQLILAPKDITKDVDIQKVFSKVNGLYIVFVYKDVQIGRVGIHRNVEHPDKQGRSDVGFHSPYKALTVKKNGQIGFRIYKEVK